MKGMEELTIDEEGKRQSKSLQVGWASEIYLGTVELGRLERAAIKFNFLFSVFVNVTKKDPCHKRMNPFRSIPRVGSSPLLIVATPIEFFHGRRWRL